MVLRRTLFRVPEMLIAPPSRFLLEILTAGALRPPFLCPFYPRTSSPSTFSAPRAARYSSLVT